MGLLKQCNGGGGILRCWKGIVSHGPTPLLAVEDQIEPLVDCLIVPTYLRRVKGWTAAQQFRGCVTLLAGISAR
jgi:hypothetical protein